MTSSLASSLASSLTSSPGVTLRPAAASDDPLLRALFARSRDDLALLPRELREPLLDLQYRARCQQYTQTHRAARSLILVAGGIDVGQMIVDDSGTETRLVDLTVAVEHRGCGIGTAAVRHVLELAAARDTRCILAVWSANQPARDLYERLGFVYLSTGDGYLHMAAAPATRVLA